METLYCKRCGQTKSAIEFGSDSRRKNGKSFYCLICRNALSALYKQHYKGTHSETFLERRRTQARKRYWGNLEHYRKYQRENMRRFHRTDKGKYHTLKFRAKRDGILFNISEDMFLHWFCEQGLQCQYCGREVEFANGRSNTNMRGLTIDRKDPNGIYRLDNMCIACRQCNTIKGYWFSYDEMKQIAKQYLIGKKE